MGSNACQGTCESNGHSNIFLCHEYSLRNCDLLQRLLLCGPSLISPAGMCGISGQVVLCSLAHSEAVFSFPIDLVKQKDGKNNTAHKNQSVTSL